MERKIKFLVLMLIVVVFVGSIFMYKNPQALAQASLLEAFGGPILDVRWCECPVPGFLITVGPPVGGAFIYTVNTILFPYWGILITNTWTLGLHNGIPVGCGHYTNYCADQVPSLGIMYMVGTS